MLFVEKNKYLFPLPLLALDWDSIAKERFTREKYIYLANMTWGLLKERKT